MASYTELQPCRINGSENLISILNLAQQALTGVFPASAEEYKHSCLFYKRKKP